MKLTIPLDYPRNLMNCENAPVIDEATGNTIGVILGKSNLVYGLKCVIWDNRFDLSNLDFDNYEIEYLGYGSNWEVLALSFKSA